MAISLAEDIDANMLADYHNSRDLYIKPWNRLGAYMVGSILGVAFYEFNNQQNAEFQNTFWSKVLNKVKEKK